MKDYQLTSHNLDQFFNDIQSELSESQVIIVSTQDAKTGKWGMAKLWRSWMSKTAEFMADNGCTMPLMTNKDGTQYGSRKFNSDDAHELFTAQWLLLDSDGTRLSWSRNGHDGMRPATKGERFNALRKHEEWALAKGIQLFNPRDSEYEQLKREQNE